MLKMVSCVDRWAFPLVTDGALMSWMLPPFGLLSKHV